MKQVLFWIEIIVFLSISNFVLAAPIVFFQGVTDPSGIGIHPNEHKLYVVSGTSGSVWAVEIKNDGSDTPDPAITPRREIERLSFEEMLGIFQDLGIAEMDRVGMPIHKKLEDARQAKVETIVINGCESEPFETSLHVLIMNKSHEILRGVVLARKLLDKEETPVSKTIKQPKKTKAKYKNEPDVEEIDDVFIPNIDVKNMKIKSGSKESIKQDNIDLDDSADLLSRIMGQED